MAARGAIRDVGRAMAMPYAAVDVIAKLVPMELGITLERALKVSPELKARYDADPQTKELIDMARKVEGMPRQASTTPRGLSSPSSRSASMFPWRRTTTPWSPSTP